MSTAGPTVPISSTTTPTTTPTTPTTTIRPRLPRDLPACAALLQRIQATDGYPVGLCSSTSPTSFLCSSSSADPPPTPPAAAWVAEQTPDGAIVGHMLLTPPDPAHSAVAAYVARGRREAKAEAELKAQAEDVIVLGRLFVAREARGRGLGRRMVEAGVEWAARRRGKRCVLNVMAKDAAAVRLYERMGWERMGEGVFDDGEGGAWGQVLYLGPVVGGRAGGGFEGRGVREV